MQVNQLAVFGFVLSVCRMSCVTVVVMPMPDAMVIVPPVPMLMSERRGRVIVQGVRVLMRVILPRMTMRRTTIVCRNHVHTRHHRRDNQREGEQYCYGAVVRHVQIVAQALCRSSCRSDAVRSAQQFCYHIYLVQ
jgi:hypothetical protein